MIFQVVPSGIHAHVLSPARFPSSEGRFPNVQTFRGKSTRTLLAQTLVMFTLASVRQHCQPVVGNLRCACDV